MASSSQIAIFIMLIFLYVLIRSNTVDGYTNFLFLKEDGTPRVGINYNSMIKGLVKKYNKQHKEPLPNTTPHSLRHTFCTQMANAGMNA